MWSKFSNAIKSLQEDSHTDVASTSRSQYLPNANLSTSSLVSNTEVLPPIPSSPGSPSKQAKRSVFRRMSKAARRDEGDVIPTPLKLSIGLPKRVKSHLHLNGNSSQASLSRISTDPRPSQDTLRSYQDPLPRPSHDSMFSPMDANNGSVRSILRDPKTPGTGQNVRFFSRDAYRVISPDQSMESEAHDPTSFLDRLQRVPMVEQPEPHPNLSTGSGGGKRPLVTEIFAPVSKVSGNDAPDIMASSDLTNIFDMSQQCDLPNIPVSFDSDIRLPDSAVELTDAEAQGFTSTPYKDHENKTMYHSMTLSDVAEEGKDDPQVKELVPTPPPSARDHDRSPFSFGQTVFHSLSRSSGSNSDKSRLSDSSSLFRNRTRAHSDGIFKLGGSISPETDINDVSGNDDLVVYASPTAEPPDPFRADATTYYTPQTMIPPTPPKGATHTRSASKEEDIIWSLRTQLALQQELCAQYEIDLGARDELVQALSSRCEKTEQEGERRRGILRTWKKKVGELERVCRGLEEEVERGREESWERSVMDEASGEALKCLQRRIETLEREKADGEKKAQKVLEEKEGLEKVLANFKEVKDANHQIQVMGGPDDPEELKALVTKTEQAGVAERERHRIAELEWEEERGILIMRGAQVETDREELAVELAAAQEQLTQKDNEYGVLKSELEAQWQHTETAGEKMDELQKERDALRKEVENLERRIGEMAEEWNESENRRMELEVEIQETIDIKEAIEREKEELEQQFHEEQEHNDHLTRALQEQEGRIKDLDSERQFAIDNVSRLENNIRQRDDEIADFSQRVVEREIAAEQLREEMAKMKREHARTVSEQARELQEMAGSGTDAKQQMEEMIRGKAEADMALSTLREQVSALKEEVERLRRQVHELQQESADKEVKIVQLTKQRSQDKEDMLGLNIALDSKQQELELLKRKLGVKGTAGSTPAQSSKIAHRRDSSAFSTPGIVRPPSALSDTGKDNIRGLETPATATKALGKSIRTNVVAPSPTPSKSTTGSMGPPPPKFSRASIGTPTPTNSKFPASLARSSSAKTMVTPTTPGIRRASSTALEQARMKVSASGRKISESPVPSELDEKENVDTPAPARVKKRAGAIPC